MKKHVIFLLFSLSITCIFAQDKKQQKFTVIISHSKKALFGSHYDLTITEEGFDIRPDWFNLVGRRKEFIPYTMITEFKREDIGNDIFGKEVFFMIFEVDRDSFQDRYKLSWKTRKQRDQFLEVLSRHLPQQMKDADLVVPK